jgi:putative MATE family efflux protein
MQVKEGVGCENTPKSKYNKQVVSPSYLDNADQLRRGLLMLVRSLQDKNFLADMIRIGSPIMLQNLIFSSLGLVDGVMIGQLGDEAVAAVGIANQVFFLVSLLFFGISSGTAIFAAQYWGRKDLPRIHSVLGLSLLMSLVGSLFFSLLAILIPAQVMEVFSTDQLVIILGSRYLRIVGFSYILTAITNSYTAVLRSTEKVKLPMVISLLALSTNTFLNYCLILGNLGFPALGVTGAGIATVISRTLETVLLLLVTYWRKLPGSARFAELINYRILSLKQFFTTTLPVVATEVIWSLGATTYNVVYARIGTEAIAAVNIAGTLDRLIFVVFFGLANACAIMIGNRIGAGETEVARDYSRKYLLVGLLSAVVLGLVMFSLANPLLWFYNISAWTTEFTYKIILILALTLPIRSANLMVLIGILRAGGDTRYAFVIDAGMIWSVGVPLAFLGAFYFHLPVYWVVAMVMTDEVIKLSLGLKRFFSGRWIHTLAVPA